MEKAAIRDIVHRYYEGWATHDLGVSRKLLSDSLVFRSPQDIFKDADAFLRECGHFGEELTGVDYLIEVYAEDEAFVILEWGMGEGQSFIDAEYLRIQDDRIAEIIVVNNSPDFGRMLGR